MMDSTFTTQGEKLLQDIYLPCILISSILAIVLSTIFYSQT